MARFKDSRIVNIPGWNVQLMNDISDKGNHRRLNLLIVRRNDPVHNRCHGILSEISKALFIYLLFVMVWIVLSGTTEVEEEVL